MYYQEPNEEPFYIRNNNTIQSGLTRELIDTFYSKKDYFIGEKKIRSSDILRMRLKNMPHAEIADITSINKYKISGIEDRELLRIRVKNNKKMMSNYTIREGIKLSHIKKMEDGMLYNRKDPKLVERLTKILKMRLQNKTFEKIGEMLRVSKERIRQLEARAVDEARFWKSQGY
tara:strand:+ start:1297 stop:1818 length:522 start_codon:yes stop_codon:yes gene_type:complete